MRHFGILLCSTAVIFACHTGSTKDEGKKEENIFQDKVLQRIYTLQNQRDSKGLEFYLKDRNPGYRKAAATAFASVQDGGAVEPLSALLADSSEAVRCAAAYALGQVKNKAAEPVLIKAYDGEKSVKVKGDILEAIGKCGTGKGLSFILDLKGKIGKNQSLLLTGQAWGLYRFALQNIVSRRGTALAVEYTAIDMPEKVRFIAANYLMRARGIHLEDYHNRLTRAFDEEKNRCTRMALASAMGKAVKPGILAYLKWIITSGLDYRIKVNAVRSLGNFDYSNVKEILIKTVSHADVHIAAAASEFFADGGKQADAWLYFETARQLYNWRSRANMLTAALKYSTDKKNKKKISQWIITAYKKSVNNYEKAHLLKALAGNPGNFRFLQSRTFYNAGKEAVLSTYGMDALVQMCRTAGDKEKKNFAGIFKKAVESGDSAMIGLAAGILRDPGMNFKGIYKDTGFLTAALGRCKLPEHIEAWLELRKTIDFFEGNQDSSATAPVPPLKNQPIDWAQVTSIPPDQRIRIKTGAGDITIQLMVDESPGSTANFVRLIKENFYRKSVFHRVAPNFVVQDGCPRGDGWGSPAFSIGSELGPLYYEEGSVGMASAGKDTEGSQWFITHSPTPHLDGRYTIFARVVSGMDILHKIEIGDKVLGFEFL